MTTDPADPVQKNLEALQPLGSIGPEGRIAPEVVVHACEVAVSDEVYSETQDDSLTDCYDGRRWRGRNIVGKLVAQVKRMGAKAAGGTNTIIASRALRGKVNAGEKAPQHAKRIALELVSMGKRIGGHTAAEVHGDRAINCGCGAADKEDSALTYIAAYRDNLKVFINDLGIDVDDELSEEIGLQAQKLVDERYALNEGPRVIDSIRAVGGDDCIQQLEGGHKEVAAVLNLVEGTTLDKEKLRERLGDDVQVFGVDVWAMKKNAHELESDPAEAHKLFVAMLYYNLGVAAVLCNASLRIVVRK